MPPLDSVLRKEINTFWKEPETSDLLKNIANLCISNEKITQLVVATLFTQHKIRCELIPLAQNLIMIDS